jgi:hypothetical protein
VQTKFSSSNLIAIPQYSQFGGRRTGSLMSNLQILFVLPGRAAFRTKSNRIRRSWASRGGPGRNTVKFNEFLLE